MFLYTWEGIEQECVTPLVRRQVIHTDLVTLARWELSKGALFQEHQHPSEQISMIEHGRMRFTLPDGQHEAGPGDILRIPPNTPHSAEVLEDCLALDVFSPRREDWIRGEMPYVR
jgi:quercetin dioxygenase-like cupin family protein